MSILLIRLEVVDTEFKVLMNGESELSNRQLLGPPPVKSQQGWLIWLSLVNPLKAVKVQCLNTSIYFVTCGKPKSFVDRSSAKY